MRVGVLGATNEIGRELVQNLVAHGDDVTCIGRTNPTVTDSFLHFDLSRPTPIDLSGFDEVYVLAWIPKPRSKLVGKLNVDGISEFIDSALKSHVTVVFFSTLGANPRSRSNYARSKFEVEQMFRDQIRIVRPATVITNDCSQVLGTIGMVSARFSKRTWLSLRTELKVGYVRVGSLIRESVNLARGSYVVRGPLTLIEFTTLMTVPMASVKPDLRKSVPRVNVPTWILNTCADLFSLLPIRAASDFADRWFSLRSCQIEIAKHLGLSDEPQ